MHPPALDLLQQDPRDEKAAEDEEEVDAEESGLGPGHSEMEGHDRCNRDEADPVERVVSPGSGALDTARGVVIEVSLRARLLHACEFDPRRERRSGNLVSHYDSHEQRSRP